MKFPELPESYYKKSELDKYFDTTHEIYII